MYTAVAVCLYNCQEPIVQLQYTDREKASQISIDDDGGCLCFYKDISSLSRSLSSNKNFPEAKASLTQKDRQMSSELFSTGL